MLKPELILQTLAYPADYQVEVLRLDLLHPEVSGNKWFKLRHNLEQAKALGHKTILTFGGAFSNHIAAMAAACQMEGFKAIGIIRGEENAALNPTLQKAKEQGMQLHFVSRTDYDQKNAAAFQNKLIQQFGPHYLIPEGGNNAAGVKGCMEILKPDFNHDYIFCACGTAATFAGILAAAKFFQKVIGISVLKGENSLVQEAETMLKSVAPHLKKVSGNEELQKAIIENSCLVNAYAFNGYAKFNRTLLAFKNQFEKEYNIPLDHVYTAKLFYAVADLLQQKKLKPGAKVLVVHSGGLQGNAGFEARYPEAKGMFS